MLGKHLKQLRTEYDITAARLARFMKVEEQDILNWEEGITEPSLKQIHELADLFDITFHELLDEEERDTDMNQRQKKKDTQKKKDKSRNKTKKKNRTKHKTKNVKQKTVEKKRNWPLIVILILLAACIGIGGFLFWKYGDEFDLIRKNDYKQEELVGTFTDESAYENSRAVLTLQSNGTYTMQFHNCSVETTGSGSWRVEKNMITLQDASGRSYTLKVSSTNKLKFTSSAMGCSPAENDVFTRGTISSDNTTSDEEKESEEETAQSYIQVGQWSGNNSTLHISSVDGTQAIFTLQSYDPQDSSHVAELKDIHGDIQNNTLNFTFDDDGYGNAGKGSIVFDASQAVFHIEITTAADDAPWSILESGTLVK